MSEQSDEFKRGVRFAVAMLRASARKWEQSANKPAETPATLLYAAAANILTQSKTEDV